MQRKERGIEGSRYVLLLAFLLVAAVSIAGCAVKDGTTSSGSNTLVGTATLSGTVTNAETSTAVSGATVSLSPSVVGVSISTNSLGGYSAELPIGSYTVTVSKSNFASSATSLAIVAGQATTKDFALTPNSGVVVSAGANASADTGESVDLAATVEILNGATGTPTYAWTQTAGATATINNAATATPTVTMADDADFKAELFTHLQDHEKTRVVGIDPFALEEAELVTFKVTVTVDGETYTDTVDITVDLPYVPNPGIRTVPINVPVLLHGDNDLGDYIWTLTPPVGSAAALDDTTSQTPYFTPDLQGTYTLDVTNSGATLSGSINIYAGSWVGVITGEDVDGNPVADTGCTACHDDSTAPDNFTPWAQSGHAEIVTQNINNPSGHWSANCASCHVVGYNTEAGASNDGFDDLATIESWSAPAHGDPDNWTNMLANYPNTARRANIQCENCHGPQNSDSHKDTGGDGFDRTSISSEVCATCHGEPTRHARYQQWQESGHGDLGFVQARGTGCECHSANAFLEWRDLAFAADAHDSITGTQYGDDPQPITCVVCHDPHNPGATSGEPNTVILRVEDSIAETQGGFGVTGVGRGAICMLCHTGRRGAFNVSGNLLANGETASGELGTTLPHHATQGAIMMGENAYFVQVGKRGSHSLIENTCTKCHMELTDPPADFSYNLSGTNHDFKATMEICSECHGGFDGESLQDTISGLNDDMSDAIAAALMADINDIAAQAEAGTVTGAVLYNPDDDDEDNIISPTEAGIIINAANPIIEMSMPGRSGRFDLETQDGTTQSSARTERFKVWVDDNNDDIIDVAEVYDGDMEGAGIIDSEIAGASVDGVITTHGQDIQKAIWNHGMLYMDGSDGVHNPDFVLDILQETTIKMNEVVDSLTP